MYQVIYDGSFNGLMNIYAETEKGLEVESVVNKKLNQVFQQYIFSVEVDSDEGIALDIQNKIEKKLGKKFLNRIRLASLCDLDNIETKILRYIDFSLEYPERLNDITIDIVADIENSILRLFRERHSMLGFIRFAEYTNGFMIAKISPKHNILPLIGRHFEKRYPMLKWAIVDTLRKEIGYYLGISYKIGTLKEMDSLEYSENEKVLRIAWKKFFDTIAIEERKSYERQRSKVPLWVREHMVEFDG